jgi:sirohydrochlorin ferrochelatase
MVARELSRILGVPVEPAFASAAAPDVASAVSGARARGHESVAVARYLLAPGFFADKVAAAALGARARWVSGCLGDDGSLAALVLRRFDAAAAVSSVA